MKASRVAKLINVHTGASSLRESELARDLELNIVLSPGAEPAKRSIMAHAALSLALRCFVGPVKIFGNPNWKISSGGVKPIGEWLGSLSALYGASSRVLWRSGGVPRGPTLFIGGGTSPGFIADAAGRVAGVNVRLEEGCEAEATACMFAVSAAFAQLFSATLLGATRRDEWTFCLKTFTTGVQGPRQHKVSPVAVGKVMLLGAGAIGGAFAYGVWLAQAQGDLLIVDRDLYDAPNLETTCMVGHKEVTRRLPKAEALAALLQRDGLHASGTLKEIRRGDPLLAQAHDYLVCGVDNPETRRVLDGSRARWLLNAGVGGNRIDAGQVLFSRHGKGDRPLSEIYADRFGSGAPIETDEHLPEEMKDECSRVPYREVSLAAPFVATTAASLLLAACVAGPAGLPSYLKLDVLNRQDRMDVRWSGASRGAA